MGSYTYTTTSPRFSLLRLHVRTLLQSAALASSSECEKVCLELESRCIENLIVRGIYKDNKVGAEIRVKIDLDELSLILSVSGSCIQDPSFWIKGDANTLNDIIMTFDELCSSVNLNREWCITYSSHYDLQELCE